MKILYIIFGVVLLLIILGGVTIYVQNQKPNIELGLTDSQLREIPDTPNCVSTQTSQKEKLVEPIAFKESLAETKKALKEALNSYGAIEIIEETDNYIYAVSTTSTMKYHDDIEVYFDEENKVIQFRSASRAGYSDRGLNRERYEAIVTLYNNN